MYLIICLISLTFVKAYIVPPQKYEHYNILTLDGGAIKGIITA